MVAKQSERPEEADVARLTIRISNDVAKQLKHRAIDENKSVNLIVEELITDYVKKKSKK